LKKPALYRSAVETRLGDYHELETDKVDTGQDRVTVDFTFRIRPKVGRCDKREQGWQVHARREL